MGLKENHHKCIFCKSEKIIFGYMGNPPKSTVFTPAGVFSLIGYRAYSYACLDCGHIGHFLPKEKLERLREKFKDRFTHKDEKFESTF